MPNLVTLLLQVAAIVITARLVGVLFGRIGQPQVMGEIVAGIMLGPSFLGWAAPALYQALFPATSLSYLNALSQVGLLLFMFLVGLEFNTTVIRHLGRAAVLTSNVSIALPFVMGSLLAAYLYPRLADPNVTFPAFALFLGAAMSITAFPVLARILTEGNLLGTQVGAVAIACAAVDDVTAWCLLAVVVFLVSASNTALPFWLTLIGTLTYIGVLLFVVRRYAHYFVDLYRRRGAITQDILGLVLILMLISGWITESLGIHALFGAFLFGAILPRDRDFVKAFIAKLEDLTVVLLLPLFFAFTGLRTNIGLLGDGSLWIMCAAIILVAILGKLGGATLASRAFGMSWREAGAIGMLMNTRGLVELVALNIGLDIGVLSPTAFTMMVLMALVTTFMTTPLLNRIYPAAMRRSAQAEVYSAPADSSATPIRTET